MKVTDAKRPSQTNSYAIPALISGMLMLAIWAYVTLTTVAAGWIHALLTFGVFLVIYGIAALDGARRTRPEN